MSGIDPAIASVLAARQAALQTQIAMAVAGKQVDAVRQQGAAAVELLEAAVAQGRAIDRGTHLDRSV